MHRGCSLPRPKPLDPVPGLVFRAWGVECGFKPPVWSAAVPTFWGSLLGGPFGLVSRVSKVGYGDYNMVSRGY